MLTSANCLSCFPSTQDHAAFKDALSLAHHRHVDPATGKVEKTVILTSADLRALEYLLRPWMWSLKHTRSGHDLSRHTVIVNNGLPAWVYCSQLRQSGEWPHHCVLDWFSCGLQESTNVTRGATKFGSMSYILATWMKVVWTREAVALGYNVWFLDMDA